MAKVGQHLRLVDDTDPPQVEEFTEEPEYVDPDADVFGTGFGDGTPPPRDRLLRYCIIASAVAHVALYLLLNRSPQLLAAKPILKPGEQVQKMRLVELPPQAKKPEPPPKKAEAISDRNHTAVQEKKPLIPQRPKPLLGRPVKPDRRIAALAPPMAPEDVLKPKKPKEAKPKDEIDKKPPAREKPVATSRPRLLPPSEPRRKPKPQRPPLDLRPTPAEIARGLAPPPTGASESFADGNRDEIVVDINTSEFEFASYLLGLKRKIQNAWIYPPDAAKNGIGGRLTLEFSIARDGRLVNVSLLDSSGHPLLDQSAVSAIKSAAPYIPFPERMRAKRLRIRANFIYVTNRVFGRIM